VDDVADEHDLVDVRVVLSFVFGPFRLVFDDIFNSLAVIRFYLLNILILVKLREALK